METWRLWYLKKICRREQKSVKEGLYQYKEQIQMSPSIIDREVSCVFIMHHYKNMHLDLYDRYGRQSV